MSNITDRGTLKGTIYRGAGTGTTDYTQLSNKPQINGHTLQGNQTGDNLDLIDKGSLKINGHTLQGNQTGDDLDLIDKGSLKINGHTLQGNQTGDDLDLINNDDLIFNVGYAGNILHNIKYNNNLYNAYAEPFSGASSGGNGTMGLVPAPLSSQGDYDKFLKGNGQWAKITFPVNIEEIDITQGDDSTMRSFSFNYIPKLIFILWEESNGWHFHTTFVYGATRCYSLCGNHAMSASNEYNRASSISYSVDRKTMTITGTNASGAFNASVGTGKLVAIY